MSLKVFFIIYILSSLFYACCQKKDLASELVLTAINEIKKDYTCPPYLETDSVFITYTGTNSINFSNQCSSNKNLNDLNQLNISQHSKDAILRKLNGVSLELDLLDEKTAVRNSSQHKSYIVISNIQQCKEDYFFSVHWIKNKRAACGGDFHFVYTENGLRLVLYN